MYAIFLTCRVVRNNCSDIQSDQISTILIKLIKMRYTVIKITIISTKGGVGKTTLTANLGGILADAGYKVLLIDADPQPTLSSYYPLQEAAAHGITHLITEATTENVISRTVIGNLDIVISDDSNGTLRDWIRDAVDGRVRLKYVLDQLQSKYDFVLIDTQGATGPLQDAAACAGDFMLSPIPPEILSAKEFVRGTVSMIQRLQPMALMNAPIGHLFGVIYKMDHTKDAKLIAAELRKQSFMPAKGSISIMNTVIPNSVVFRDAATQRIPVHRAKSATNAISAKDTMIAFTKELIPNLPDFESEV